MNIPPARPAQRATLEPACPARPAFEDVRAAAAALAGTAILTPLLENDGLNDRVGGRILIKAECLQRTGAFKFRGAYFRLSRLSAEERSSGVITWSSGNHGVGIAAAAELLGVEAAVVMPSDAPAIKVSRIRAHGAGIHFYDRLRENREEVTHAIAARSGAVVIPSYDDPLVIAGQGTVGREILDQAAALGTQVDQLIAGAAGGGLLAGCAIVFGRSSPSSRLYSVEPEHYNDLQLSLEAGRRVTHAPAPATLCDCLLTAMPGAVTFPILHSRLAGALTVTDEDVAAAVVFAAEELKLVVEPGGAVALAAVLAGKVALNGTTCIVLTGGNVDRSLLSRLLAAEPATGVNPDSLRSIESLASTNASA